MPAGAAPRNLPVARGRSTWPGMCEAWRRLGQHLSCPQPLPTSAASLGVTGQGAAQAMGAPQHCARPFPCSSLSALFPFPSPSSSQGPRSATSTPAGATLPGAGAVQPGRAPPPRGRPRAAGGCSGAGSSRCSSRHPLVGRRRASSPAPRRRGQPRRPLRDPCESFFFPLLLFFFPLPLLFYFFSLSLLFPTLSSPVIPVILSARC